MHTVVRGAILVSFAALTSISTSLIGTTEAAHAETSRVATIEWRSDCYVGKRVMCADQTNNKFAYFEYGKLIYELDARFGPTGVPDISPTRNGDWKIFRKVKNDWSTLYNVSMPDSMYFSGGEAVHYSADFAETGYTKTSHGCINTRDRAALDYIYGRVKIGDPIHVYGVPPAPSI